MRIPTVGRAASGGCLMHDEKYNSFRELRKNLTDAEKKLWKHLRLKNIGGNKFRRQQPIGKYIVDFVCPEKKLIVGVDGGQHGQQVSYDNDRTTWLESRGFRVVGFWNNEVLGDVGIVLDSILRTLEDGG